MFGRNGLSRTGLENRSNIVSAAQRNDAAAVTDATFRSTAPAFCRWPLVIFNQIPGLGHCEFAGGDIRQIGRLGWLALPTDRQEFMEFASVCEGALTGGPADLDELAQDQSLLGAKDLEGPGEDSDDPFDALVASEASDETQHAWIDTLQGGIDRRIGLIAEDGRSAAQIFEQASLPMQ